MQEENQQTDSKNIEVVYTGLICDNPDCDWEDETVQPSDYKKWLNQPCPKCGEIVLTEEDQQNAEILDLCVDFLNDLSPEELKTLSKLTEPLSDSLKNDPIFSETSGIEHLEKNADQPFSMTVNTHKGIKITEVKPID